MAGPDIHPSGLGYLCPVCLGDEGYISGDDDYWHNCDHCDGVGYVGLYEQETSHQREGEAR